MFLLVLFSVDDDKNVPLPNLARHGRFKIAEDVWRSLSKGITNCQNGKIKITVL
jgi:hypothetical protein